MVGDLGMMEKFGPINSSEVCDGVSGLDDKLMTTFITGICRCL